jgi:ferritin
MKKQVSPVLMTLINFLRRNIMISKETAKALNEQINKELFSAYLYQSMSAYSSFTGLKGFANWFQVQAQEEVFHAQKIYKYILDQGDKIILEAIDKPQIEFKSPLDMAEQTLTHERKVTASINNLVKLAHNQNDMATVIFLQWFVTEQVEEEANASEMIDKLKLARDNGAALLMIDKELQARVFNAQAEASE